jgi:hypothetical protein
MPTKEGTVHAHLRRSLEMEYTSEEVPRRLHILAPLVLIAIELPTGFGKRIEDESSFGREGPGDLTEHLLQVEVTQSLATDYEVK